MICLFDSQFLLCKRAGSALGKLRHTKENAAYFEKCATFKKMRYTWKNAPNLRKFGKLREMPTFRKMQHTTKNAPHLRKCGTLGKMHHTWINASHM